ncbi:MAG: hypothetical protein UHD05_05245, partial [Ruminococcus sp.]|nr:hypothetical protein [Ruminococcus sp.]
MVSKQFHFNGFPPNMLYFFISILIFLRRLYLVTPTFIIEPVYFMTQTASIFLSLSIALLAGLLLSRLAKN